MEKQEKAAGTLIYRNINQPRLIPYGMLEYETEKNLNIVSDTVILGFSIIFH